MDFTLIPKRRYNAQGGGSVSLPASILGQDILNGVIGTVKITDLAVTDAKINSLTVSKLTTGNLTATGTITTGSLVTGAAGTNRIEITSARIAGYNSSDALQFYLQASDGKAYAGAGAVILDSAGITIKGELINLQSVGGFSRGTLGGLDDLRLVAPTGVGLGLIAGANLVLDATDTNNYIVCLKPLYLQERSGDLLDVAGLGQIWVKNTTPNQLWFTDDAGNAIQIGSGGITEVVQDTTPELGGTLTGNNAYGIINLTTFGVAATTDVATSVVTTGTTTAAYLRITSGNGTTSARYSYFLMQSDETSPQSWAFGLYGGKSLTLRDVTSSITKLTITSGASAAATWANVTQVSPATNGAMDLGSTTYSYLNLYAYSAYLKEGAAGGSDVAGLGQFWVKNTTPNQPWFTDDAGSGGRLLINLVEDTTPQLGGNLDTNGKYISGHLLPSASSVYLGSNDYYWLKAYVGGAYFVGQGSSPGAPATGSGLIYVTTGGNLYFIWDGVTYSIDRTAI